MTKELTHLSALLILPHGRFLQVEDDPDAAALLADYDAVGPIVHIDLETEGLTFEVWMGVGVDQQGNPHARHAIDQLTAVHFQCLGPVLLVGLDDDTVAELSRG